MFRRRKPRSYGRRFAEGIYPRGGWSRAVSYMMHRLRRLPDPPHRIARGIAAGVFVCFTPFYGFHFIIATAIVLVIQGNILAAIIATFFGNPLTFPLIAVVSVDLGSWMLGLPGGMQLPGIVKAFADASVELWANLAAMFNDDITHWDRLHWFFRMVFMPYLVGGIIPGVLCGGIAYSISHRVISRYQKGRIKRLKKRYEKKLALAAKTKISTVVGGKSGGPA